MSKGHTPERKCIGCGKKGSADSFIRIVRPPQKSNDYLKGVDIEKERKIEGRGAYLCKSAECLLKARKARRLERIFSRRIDDSIYSDLEGMVSKTG